MLNTKQNPWFWPAPILKEDDVIRRHSAPFVKDITPSHSSINLNSVIDDWSAAQVKSLFGNEFRRGATCLAWSYI
jgi:hypothetical protein